MDNTEIPEVLQNFNAMRNAWRDSEHTTCPYWIMRHQLIYKCTFQHEAEEDIDLLIQEGALLQRHLPLARNETILLLSTDYKAFVRDAIETIAPEWAPILPSWIVHGPHTTHCIHGTVSKLTLERSLANLLSDIETHKIEDLYSSSESMSKSNGASETNSFHSQYLNQTPQQFVQLLTNAGCLRQSSANTFCFSAPGTGLFVSNLLNGRKALLNFLKRKRTTEESLSPRNSIHSSYFGNNDFNSSSLSAGWYAVNELLSIYKDALSVSTSLPMDYLIADAIPLGLVEKAQGPIGPIIRYSRTVSKRRLPPRPHAR